MDTTHCGGAVLGLALSYNSPALWCTGSREERVHSNLLNQLFRIQICFLTLLCSAFAGCAGVFSGQDSAVVTRAQMQMGTLVKITAAGRGESAPQAAATPRVSANPRFVENTRTRIPTRALFPA